MPVALSLINMKGGVGKTTIASQLAHAASADGLRVLAIDLDPQSNLSHSILGDRAYRTHLKEDRPTVAQILDAYIPSGSAGAAPSRIDPDKVILSGVGSRRNSTLDLIPSRLELSRVLKNPTGKERRLARFVARISNRYDLIIIDCAPTESILTDAAYFASRYLIVPVKPEFLATVGLPLLARSVQDFQAENDDHTLEIVGLVLNDQAEYMDNQEKQVAIQEVRSFAKKWNWRVFSRRMLYSRSYTRAAREATSLAQTLYVRGSVVDEFHELKNEILQAVEVEVGDR